MITNTWDTRGLSRAMNELGRITGEDRAPLVNETARYVAIRAYRETRPARAADIRTELSAVRTSRTTGKPHTLAEMIVAAEYRKTGIWPTGKNGVAKAAKALITRRARSASWIRAGFIPSFQAFGARGGVRKFKRPPGDATKARDSRLPTAEIRHFDEGFPVQFPGVLESAVKGQTRFLEKLAVKKLQKAAKRSGWF